MGKQPDSKPILEDQLGLGQQSAVTSTTTSVANTPVTPDTSGATKTSGPKKTELRPWFQRPSVWGWIVLSLGLLALATVGLLSWRNRAANHDFITERWRGITQATERAQSEAAKSDYATFNDTYQALADLEDRLEDTASGAEKQPSWLADHGAITAFKDALSKLQDYTAKAKAQANDLSKVQSSDLDTLKSSATATKLAVENDVKQFNFVKDRVGDDFYTLSDRYGDVIEAHEESEAKKKADDQALITKEEQAKQDQADAEEASSRWTQAYIAGNIDDMKKYMTPAFAKEYDFTQVTASYRTTNYPTTYRRVSTEKKSAQFEIIETITYVSKSDYGNSTYTSTFIFLVSQDAASKKWLVNSQRYQ